LSGSESRTRVLVVDDDAVDRELLGAFLTKGGYMPLLAESAASARRLLNEQDIALVMCDINMPGESGISLARHVVGERTGAAVVMVSVHDDVALAEGTIALGAYGYLIKPVNRNDVLVAVAGALQRRRVELENRERFERLERRLDDQARDLRQGVEHFEEAAQAFQLSQEETLHRLTRAIELRSHETGDHIERVGRYSELLARRLDLSDDHCVRILRASALHDIGKVAISDHVLLKDGRLSPEEREEMERHPEIGHYVLSGSNSPVLHLGATIALAHHEWYDGAGYPHGLAGPEIPLEGRIVAIGDVFDALTHDRIYRPAFAVEQAVDIMRAERGTHFDPKLLDEFLVSLDEVVEIGNGRAESA
jgi:cyclic di-GMP phosphodiesterase